jgi:PAS domain S-box-containing protein
MRELRLRRRFSLLGLGLAVSYWLIETVADSVFGGEGPIATRLLPADANEVWMRLIIVALILGFTGYVSRTLEKRAQTEQRLRVLESAVEHTDDAVLITTAELDPPGPAIVYANEAFCRQTGYAAKELLGETPRMLQGPDSDRAVLDQLRRCLERKHHFVGRLTNYRKDGSSLRVELRISPVYDSAGTLTHWVSVQHDITESERAEAALKESEERYRLTVEATKDYAIFMIGTDGRISSWNMGAERVFGYSEEEIVGEDSSLLFTPEDRRRGAAEKEQRRAETEGRAENERWHVRKDGSRFWGSGFVRPVRNDTGVLCGFAKVVRDATEHKRAEEALRQAEEKYRSIFENAVEGIFQTSLDGRILMANPAAARIFGYDSPEEAMASIADVGRQLYVDPDDRVRIQNSIRQHGEVSDFETRMYRKDGTMIWVSVSAHALRDDDGKLLGFEGMLEDVTERKRLEEARGESEERYRAVIEQAGEGIFLFDPHSKRILETNPAFREMFGYGEEEVGGITLYDLVPQDPEGVDRNVERALRQRHVLVGEREYRRKDGSRIDVEVSGSVFSYGGKEVICSVVRDITERKRSESALHEVKEAERRQIARDLHDDVLQELMDALYSMQVTRMKLRDEGIDIPEIDQQIDDLRKATQALRDAVNNLRRGSIREQPFLLLLRSVVEANRRKAPYFEIDLDVDAAFSSEPSGNVGIELLRIIQEALVNARRHSRARHVWVSIRGEEDLLIAEVVDDGRGFDPETAWG